MFSSTGFFAQNSISLLDSIANSNLSQEKKIRDINEFLESSINRQDTAALTLFTSSTKILYKLKAKEAAVKWQEHALKLHQSMLPYDSISLQKTTSTLAFFLYANKNYSKAITAARQAIIYNPQSELSLKNRSRIASSYLNTYDYNNALLAYEDLILSIKLRPDKKALLRNTYINASIACQEIRTTSTLKKDLDFLKSADSISKNIETSPRILFQLYLGMGNHYNQSVTLNTEEANFHFQKALNIAKDLGSDRKIGDVYFILGNLYNGENPDLSLKYLNQSMSFTNSNDSLRLFQLNANKGYTYTQKEDFQKGIELSNKALSFLIKGDFSDLENVKSQLPNSRYKMNLIKVIPEIAEMHLVAYKKNGDKNHLKQSLTYFKLSDYLIDVLKLNTRTYRSKLFWSKLKTDVYGKAIHASFLANNIDDAFYFMEKNKALLLQEDIATRDFKASLDIPSDVLERELDLKTKVFQLNQNIIAQDNNQDSLRNILTNTKTELAVLQDSLNIKTQDIKIPELLSIVDAQQNMSQDDLILEYHISIDDGFGIYSNNDKANMLLITKDTVKFYEIPNQQKLKNDVNQLLASIKKPFETQQDIQDYKTLSYDVYETLFPDEFAKQLIKNKSLDIIPDSYLNFLPFEALVINNTEEIKYLIEETDVRYNYSMSFLNQLDKEFANDNNVLGIAPVEFSYDDLNTLENSKTEIEAMLDSFNGEELIGLTATKENFLNGIPNHNIIHLATHADAQDNISPWIALADGKLYLDELYNTSNTAKLVVLSGCNTTLGTEEIGEGVMSLARGFFYSGTQSVISTLWSIDDNSTTTIVTDFYKSLEKGTTKSQALRDAKLNYLNSHNRSEASPYYWASFVIIGSNKPIPASQNYWVWFAIALGICLLFFTAYLLKYRKR